MLELKLKSAYTYGPWCFIKYYLLVNKNNFSLYKYNIVYVLSLCRSLVIDTMRHVHDIIL